MNRRDFIKGTSGLLFAAPAIVHAANIMRIRPFARDYIVVPCQIRPLDLLLVQDPLYVDARFGHLTVNLPTVAEWIRDNRHLHTDAEWSELIGVKMVRVNPPSVVIEPTRGEWASVFQGISQRTMQANLAPTS